MQSQTLKTITLLYVAAVGVVWMIISITGHALLDLPSWVQEVGAGLIGIKYIDGRWGKSAERAQGDTVDMESDTLRWVVLITCVLVGVTWVWVSIGLGKMVDLPTWVQVFGGIIIPGKYTDGLAAKFGRKAQTLAPQGGA